jgi:hypothetical protein
MTTTQIPYDARGRRMAAPSGPTECAACHGSLFSRPADDITNDVIPATNQEARVHTWRHDVDDLGRAICRDCSEEADQDAAYLMIVRWQGRDRDNREVRLVRDAVLLIAVGSPVVRFAAPRGNLCVGAVKSFVDSDPMATRFTLVAGAEDECPKTERNLEHAL